LTLGVRQECARRQDCCSRPPQNRVLPPGNSGIMKMALADAPSLGHITSPIASSFPVKIVTDSPSFGLTKSYRCSVCAGKEFRSRPRTLTECYILPLLLMKPVRWAACFHREYRVIFTSVRERSGRHDSSSSHSNRNAA